MLRGSASQLITRSRYWPPILLSISVTSLPALLEKLSSAGLLLAEERLSLGDRIAGDVRIGDAPC
jgi:hypothetical protein